MIKTLNQIAPIINLYPYNSNLQLKHIVNDTVVLEVPKDRYQYFVHMCDYLASRKVINVKFEGEEIE